ncbi:MAG: chemotaxis protein CheW [Planctomycetaceae bacterium]
MSTTAAAATPDALSLQDLLAQIDLEASHDSLGTGNETPRRVTANPATKHVVFMLHEAHYAVPLSNVLELQRLPHITALPHVPDWLRGVTNMRGEVLSVVDLRSLLGMPPIDNSASQRLIVVRSTREEISTGWIVDRFVGIRSIAAEDLKPCSTLMTGPAVSFLSGIVERDARLVAVLDVNRVLSSPEMRQFEPTWQEA